jgi:hypothetical protein
MLHIESYRRIVGDYPIAEVYKKVRKLYGKNILDINSTYTGDGVAEMKKKLYLKTNEKKISLPIRD